MQQGNLIIIIFAYVVEMEKVAGVRLIESNIQTFGHSGIRAFGHSGIRAFGHSGIWTEMSEAITSVMTLLIMMLLMMMTMVTLKIKVILFLLENWIMLN